MEDPLDIVLRPPADETAGERRAREEREAEARRVSLAIDASIKAERVARRKKRIVKVLLLGQSESGKSTTLRQFQRLYTPTAFRQERILWRAVIQLNIARSIATILDALARPHNHPHPSPRTRPVPDISDLALPSPPTYPPPLPPDDNSDSELTHIHYHHRTPSHSPPFHPSPSSSATLAHSSSSIPLTPSLDALRSRLAAPLRHVEALLIAKLVNQADSTTTHFSASSPAARDHSLHDHSPTGSFSHPRPPNNILANATNNNNTTQEPSIRFGPGWKGVLANAILPSSSAASSTSSSPTLDKNTDATKDEAQEILHSLRKDMIQLWHDPTIREILRKRKIRLEDSSGFFLDDIDRVTSLHFLPSDDDVLKARLKTVGVSEYKFEIELGAGRDTGTEWRIVDVGGSRSQRPSWVPFFDDVDAIIFLAPISAFDQVLSEDRSTNRLEDSVLLWKAVCSSKLLAGVDLVLFLNKCDILQRKLQGGVGLVKYVRNYGDRPNNLESVCKYLRGKFSAIHREYSPSPRKFYAFCTSVTDSATTAGIIASVRDMVIRQHLKSSKLL